MTKPGRKPIIIDEDTAIRAAKCHCTDQEIAAILGVSVDTLDRRKALKKKIAAAREHGKSSLRRAQWKTALSGNAAMQIWLGKQHLGQRDKHEIGTGGEALEFIVRLPPGMEEEK